MHPCSNDYLLQRSSTKISVMSEIHDSLSKGLNSKIHLFEIIIFEIRKFGYILKMMGDCERFSKLMKIMCLFMQSCKYKMLLFLKDHEM